MRSSNVVKRTLCLLLLASMLIVAAMPAFASTRGSGAYVVDKTETEGERLIVHDGPWGNEITRLNPGTVVVYKSRKSGWWKVEFYTGSGWVDPKYLTSVTALPNAKYKAIKKIPVFSKAKTSSTYLGMLKTSKKVSIVNKSKNWVRIRLGSHYGWTQAKYLRRVS